MIFRVMAEPKFIEVFLQEFNQRNGTEFVIEEIHYDEVTFVSINSKDSTNNEIIKLGIEYAKSIIKYNIVN